MLTKKQKDDRFFVPITPGFHSKQHRNIWYTIGTAIILIVIFIAIILGVWSAMT
ncbi:MAG: hypothetical protein ACOYXT_26210 [Bacteroidota bacterium]